jgi:hypothetical protein
MLVYADGTPAKILKSGIQLDRTAATTLAKDLFSKDSLKPDGFDGDLSFTSPPDDEVHIGCFPGLTIIAAKEFGIDYPSHLPQKYLDAAKGRNIYLHAMHSTVDWFAFAVWENGRLQRSLSLSPDGGIFEDIGEKFNFEEPYWNGQHPACDPEGEEDSYPLPFHPLDLGEVALATLFGYQLEGEINPALLDPEDIPLVRFRRKKPIWKIW